MPDLLQTIDNGVAVLTLNRPDRLNALSEEMVAALCDTLPRLGTDPAVGAVLLTGAGRGFCAGGDVKRMASTEQTMEERQEGLRWRHESVRLLRTIGKVVIAAVNGPAAGAGLSLALACDLRIAARSARFRTAFAGVGFSGDFGGSWSLTRLVGTAKAREMYYLNPQIDAEEALRLGMVSAVVDDDALMADAMAMARRIADGPRVAFRLHEAQPARGGNRAARDGAGHGGPGPGPHRDHRGPQGSRPRLRGKARACVPGPLTRLPFPAHRQAACVQHGKQGRVTHDGFGDVHCLQQLSVCQVPDGRTADHGVPPLADRGIQADTHEAVIVPNGPLLPRCHPRQGFAHQGGPA